MKKAVKLQMIQTGNQNLKIYRKNLIYHSLEEKKKKIKKNMRKLTNPEQMNKKMKIKKVHILINLISKLEHTWLLLMLRMQIKKFQSSNSKYVLRVHFRLCSPKCNIQFVRNILLQYQLILFSKRNWINQGIIILLAMKY